MQDNIVSVIGGSGFLGRYVVKHLAEAGYRVRVLCRHPERADFLKPSGNVGQIAIDYLDMARLETIAGKLNGSFAVVNLVGLLFESGKQKFSRVHAQGAERLAQEAAAVGAQAFVQISALGVDKATKSAYARTKLAGEKAVLSAFPSATILRPSVLFGAEDNFFNQFAHMSILSPALPAIGGGATRFQPVYVDDVAKAVLAAIERADAAGKTYELGGPTVYSFRELLRYVGEVTGRKRALISIPFAAAKMLGSIAQLLPTPPLTKDQVTLLQTDNVVSDRALTFTDFAITPTPLEAIVPHYLRFRKKAA